MRLENKVDCTESQSLMAAYIDDELDASSAARFAAHLAGCPACADAHGHMLALRRTLRTHASRYTAPAQLRQSIIAALPRPEVRTQKRPKQANRWPWAWINFGVATACGLALTLTLQQAGPSATELEEQEIVASHARSLMADHLADVASTDQHTVKPWFAGKLDYAPTVYDFAQQGFPLVGGRLDYVRQRTVAALAYRHRLHVVNLFVWPDKSHADTTPQTGSRQGYHLIHWNQAGMCYWMISDMNAQDLNEFRGLLAAQIGKDAHT
jgi:anti-sigma factor (TIGR02949 family)